MLVNQLSGFLLVTAPGLNGCLICTRLTFIFRVNWTPVAVDRQSA